VRGSRCATSTATASRTSGSQQPEHDQPGRGPSCSSTSTGSLLLSRTQEGIPADPETAWSPTSERSPAPTRQRRMMDVLARWAPITGSCAAAATPEASHPAAGRRQRRRAQPAGPHRAPRSAERPDMILTRVVESGSACGRRTCTTCSRAPWDGEYDVTVRFADGVVTAVVEPGDEKIIFEDGRVEASPRRGLGVSRAPRRGRRRGRPYPDPDREPHQRVADAELRRVSGAPRRAS